MNRRELEDELHAVMSETRPEWLSAEDLMHLIVVVARARRRHAAEVESFRKTRGGLRVVTNNE